MARVMVFGDEGGNFDFRVSPGATKYFVLGTVTMNEDDIGHELLDLRRELAWQGVALDSSFHATTDRQIVRDEVFRLLAKHDIRIDATIFEKRKTKPDIQNQPDYFYKLAWYLHFKFVCPKILTTNDELLVVAASIGTKKRRRGIKLGIEDVVNQCAPSSQWQVAFWPANSDPCLQVADYCTWAIQRKWETGDLRSYDQIKSKIRTEYEGFGSGASHYY